VGSWLGGDTSFVRLVGTLRLYHPLPFGLIGAARVKLGTADPLASSEEIPLWERFYAGGIDSVRGYARRRVGPLARDEPIGGRSLSEGSIELRRLLTRHLALAVFFDGGQASRKSFDAPVHRLQYGTGAGIHYTTPIGPIRLDVGVPLDRRGDDEAWQLHVSVGQAF
jgi:outer membrane translocation and assembly module TamA